MIGIIMAVFALIVLLATSFVWHLSSQCQYQYVKLIVYICLSGEIKTNALNSLELLSDRIYERLILSFHMPDAVSGSETKVNDAVEPTATYIILDKSSSQKKNSHLQVLILSTYHRES